MADKSIGDLPAASAIYDNDLFLLEQSGEAKNLRGALYKAYLQGFVDAASAASSEAAAALAGVRDAINNIPEGAATPIVNDLTTGGTSMALSAEMGKQLLPLDGSKAMTGDMGIKKIDPRISLSDDYTGGDAFLQASSNRVVLQARDDASSNQNRRQLQLLTAKASAAIASALRLAEWSEGASKQYVVFGEHNKPSGSYTGNGSAAERQIPVGAFIGKCLAIWASNGTAAFLTGGGAICRKGSTVYALGYGGTTYNLETAGKLTLVTADEALNANGVTYTYLFL